MDKRDMLPPLGRSPSADLTTQGHIDAIRRLLAAQTDALAHLSRTLAVVQFDLAGIRKSLEENLDGRN